MTFLTGTMYLHQYNFFPNLELTLDVFWVLRIIDSKAEGEPTDFFEGFGKLIFYLGYNTVILLMRLQENVWKLILA